MIYAGVLIVIIYLTVYLINITYEKNYNCKNPDFIMLENYILHLILL